MAGILGALGTGATIGITIKAIDSFSGTFDKLNKKVGGLGTLAKGAIVGIAAIGTAIAAMGVASVKAAGEFEQTTVAFTTMLGSGEEAAAFLQELADFAKKTPFTIQGVEKSARQLMAVGFEANDVIPVLTDVGNIASGLGLGEAGLQRLILNLGQVQSQGKLTGRELRDFAVAGIPLLDELAKSLGKPTTEIQEMVSAGEISTEMVLKAFNDMGSEGGRFANLMEKQAKTVEGRFSNLKDSVSLLARDMGKQLLPAVGDVIDMFNEELLPSLEPLIPVIGEQLTGVIQKLSPYLPKLVEVFGRLVVVVLKLFDAIWPVVEPLLDIAFIIADVMISAFEGWIPLIKLVAYALKPLLELLKPIAEFLGEILKFVFSLVGGVMEDFTDELDNITGTSTKKTKSSSTNNTSITGGTEWIQTGANTWSAPVIKLNDFIIQPNSQDTIIGTKNPNNLGMTLIIEGNVYGTDPDEIADAIMKNVGRSIRI